MIYVCAIKNAGDTLRTNCVLSKYIPNSIWKPIQNNKLCGEFSQEMYKKDEKWQKTQREMEKRGQQQIGSGCLSKLIYRQEVKIRKNDKTSMVCDKDKVLLAVNYDQIMLTGVILPKLALFVYLQGFGMSDID